MYPSKETPHRLEPRCGDLGLETDLGVGLSLCGGGCLTPRFPGWVLPKRQGAILIIHHSLHSTIKRPPTCTRFTACSPQYRLCGNVDIRSAATVDMESSAQQQQQQQQPKPPGPGLFQCTTCRRTFTRIDHLARHVRSRELRTRALYRERL